MMKHGETKQSQQSPLLTPGAPGANTDGQVTAFFNIDRLPSSPGDEKSSTSAEQCRRAERRHQCLELRLDNNGPGRGTEDQSIKGSSDAAPFSGTFVPIMNPTNPSESSVAEPAKDVRSADSVVNLATGPGPASLTPTSRFADSHSLAVPFGGEAYQDGTSTRDTKISSKPVGSDAGDIASATTFRVPTRRTNCRQCC